MGRGAVCVPVSLCVPAGSCISQSLSLWGLQALGGYLQPSILHPPWATATDGSDGATGRGGGGGTRNWRASEVQRQRLRPLAFGWL